jgi:hypothetical protein
LDLPARDLWIDAAVAQAGRRDTREQLEAIDGACWSREDFGVSYLVNLLRMLAGDD